MRTVLGVLVPAIAAVLVAADDPPPPARWGIRHTLTLEHPATALAVGKTWAAVGQKDGTVIVWGLEEGKELAKLALPGPPQPVRALTGPADGTVLFGIDGEKTGFRWDWSKPGGGRFTRRPFDGQVLAVAPDGKRWATFDGEKLRVLDADVTAELFKPATAYECELLPDDEWGVGLRRQWEKDRGGVTGLFPPGDDGFVGIVDGYQPGVLEKQRKLFRWTARGALFYASRSSAPGPVALSPDGAWLANSGEWPLELFTRAGELQRARWSTLILDDRVTGKVRAEILPSPVFRRPTFPARERAPRTGFDSAMTFHPRSRWLVTGGSDGKLRFWDVPGFVHLPAEAALARLNGEQWDRPSDLLAGHTAAVRAVAFSPDGRFLVSSADDKRVLIWVPKP